jgi:serine/threonine-protein kinase
LSHPTPTTDPQNPTLPGSVLAGKYRVEKIIGQGGMGVVVEARHIALDERVALKFLLAEYAHHPEAAARFLREARAAVKIKSEHVARVSDVGTLDSGAPYMVMEYLNGSDLSQVLETRGNLPIDDAVDFLIQGCEAIAEAHSYGIVHRDLKPANLFLSKRPNGNLIVKVLDFGISKMAEPGVDNLTKTTAAMGSALYMSPEQMQQTRGVDHRTDIYALGVALYELLAGKQPFYADTLPQLCAEVLTGTPTPIRFARPDVPEGLAATLEKAYARDRANRYQSIAEFVVALAPYAPSRSQITIDSVAKMASIPSAIAGGPGAQRVSVPSNATLLLPENAYGQSGSGALHPGAVSAGPVSLQPAGVPKKSGAGLAIALGLTAVAVISVLGFVFLRSPGAAGSGGPQAASTTMGAPSSGAVDAVPTTTASVATAEPVPTAAATATIAPSATVTVVSAPPLPRQPGKAGVPVKSRPPRAGQPTDVGF